MTVAPVNPTLAVTVPGPQNSQPIGIVLSAANGNAVTISDVTAGNTAIQVALTATNGAITLAGTQGLTFSLGSGQQNAQIVMAGTLAQLNAAMNGMLFRPTAQSAELQVVASAQGNSGTGSGAVVITQVLTPPPPSPPIVNPNLPGPQPIVPVQSVAPPILAVVLAVSPVPPARPPQTLIQPTSRPQRVPAATISFSALQQQNVAQAWSVESTICQPGVVKPHGRVLAGPVNPPAVKAELSCVEAGSPLWDDLNAMDKKLGAPLTRQEVAVGTALTVSAAFTAGYVIWMLRGGMLLTSLLAQMPAWRLVDPLVVLSRTSDLDDGEQETLETIVDSLEDRPIEPAAQAETIA